MQFQSTSLIKIRWSNIHGFIPISLHQLNIVEKL